MTKQFPPLNPLRTFEVAARSRTFTEAAEELQVTQAAVSRQIGVLEGYYKVKLFERDLRSVRLTPAGQRLHKHVSPAFEIIHWASHQLVEESRNKPVLIRTYPTFAVRWLMPRLREFMSSYPDANLLVQTELDALDFVQTDADLQIPYGTGRWENMKGYRLLQDEIAPVCSPQVLGKKKLQDPHELTRYTLLHSKYRWEDWPEWMARAGLRSMQTDRGLTFESSLITYQAAAEGLGVAMGQLGLLQSELERHNLVQPVELSVRRNAFYWLIWPEHRKLSRDTRIFVEWLAAQVDPELATAP